MRGLWGGDSQGILGVPGWGLEGLGGFGDPWMRFWGRLGVCGWDLGTSQEARGFLVLGIQGELKGVPTWTWYGKIPL